MSPNKLFSPTIPKAEEMEYLDKQIDEHSYTQKYLMDWSLSGQG